MNKILLYAMTWMNHSHDEGYKSETKEQMPYDSVYMTFSKTGKAMISLS